MKTTRYGKIGRLPKLIRDQLNHRLEDNEPTKPTLSWLNHQTDVQAILKAQFDAKPITEQNLSAWRQGGFQDWLQQEQTSDLLQHFRENTEALAQVAGEKPLTDRLASFLEVELVRLSQLLPEESDPDKRLDRVCRVLKELRHLRHHDHQAIRLAHDQELWQREKAKLETEDQIRQQTEQRRRARDPLWAHLDADAYAELLGGTPAARQMANELAESQHDLPAGALAALHQTSAASVPPPVSPNPANASPAESLNPQPSTINQSPNSDDGFAKPAQASEAQSKPIQPNPTQSAPSTLNPQPSTTAALPIPHSEESKPIQPNPTPANHSTGPSTISGFSD